MPARIGLAHAEPAALTLRALHAGAARDAVAADAVLVGRAHHALARVRHALAAAVLIDDAVLVRLAHLRERRAVVRLALAGHRDADQPRRAHRHRADRDARARSHLVDADRLVAVHVRATGLAVAGVVDAEVLRVALLAERARKLAARARV